MIVVGAGPVDDLDELEIGGLAAAFGRVGLAGGGLEGAALPAAVLRVGDREVAVDALEVGLEAVLGRTSRRRAAIAPPTASTSSTARTMISQVGTRRLHQVSAAGAQASTARESRCAPTLRFTRWSALSTVLQSQSIISPITV